MFLLIFDLMVKTKRRLGYVALGGVAISSFFLFRLWGVDYTPTVERWCSIRFPYSSNSSS